MYGGCSHERPQLKQTVKKLYCAAVVLPLWKRMTISPEPDLDGLRNLSQPVLLLVPPVEPESA